MEKKKRVIDSVDDKNSKKPKSLLFAELSPVGVN